jgi:hypothetical protein
LNDIKTVIVAVGGGMDPFNSVGSMNKIVQNANGTIIKTLTAFRSNDNLNMNMEGSKITF